jgi:predicted MFS family arabinose efflux permease
MMDRDTLRTALGLALAAAVSLGTARFAYALLLPPMRAELGWSYFTAGAMNTVNAAGYLVGALLMPRLLQRLDARALMLAGGGAAALLLAAHGLVRSDAALYALRLGSGLASAASFVGGGLLAARLASQVPVQAGQVLGLYYGGTGIGIVVASLLVPPLVAPGAVTGAVGGALGGAMASGWAWAWLALGVVSAMATAATAAGTRALHAPPAPGAPRVPLPLVPLAFGLAGYACFGLGYIGYMTFIVTLLREQGAGGGFVTAFYTLLGLACMASSFLWAGLLQRHRGGRPMATLNALLAVATLLPVATAQPLVVLASGVLFGSVFLSVVASTTALVRHNAAPAQWASGIGAFTIVFAAGQIVGPSLSGLIADTGSGSGPGGLQSALAASAGVLALGALLAAFQRPRN